MIPTILALSMVTCINGYVMRLPVFPLKRVRLPTEDIGLNLIEDRYLSLAESVIGSTNQTFGAVCCRNHPHRIRAGVGAAVPIIRAGDLGVLCKLVNHEEGITRNGKRRKISTRSLVVGRFVVQSVVATGFDDDVADINGGNCFIMVEATAVDDDEPTLPAAVESAREAEAELWALLLDAQKRCETNGPGIDSTSRAQPGIESRAARRGTRFVDFTRLGAVIRQFAPLLDGVTSAEVGPTLRSGSLNDDESALRVMTASQRQQLLSFSVAAALRDLEPDHSEWLLHTTDTAARLEYCTSALAAEVTQRISRSAFPSFASPLWEMFSRLK